MRSRQLQNNATVRLRLGCELRNSRGYEGVAIYVKNACEIIQDPASNPKERPFPRPIARALAPGTPGGGCGVPGSIPGVIHYYYDAAAKKPAKKKRRRIRGEGARFSLSVRAGGKGEGARN